MKKTAAPYRNKSNNPISDSEQEEVSNDKTQQTTQISHLNNISLLLKQHYISQEHLPSFIEDDDSFPPQKIKDCYVNLSIVNQENFIKKKEQLKYIKDLQKLIYNPFYDPTHLIDNVYFTDISGEIGIEDIFKENIYAKDVGRIIMYGNAGIGKTTLLHKISYEWGIGKLWQNKFKYIFRLPLRELIGWNASNKSLKDFIFKCCFKELNFTLTYGKKITLRNIEEILQYKDKILILLDGYDEVTNISKERNDIINEALIYPNLIMSSRPNAVGITLMNKFDVQLANIGFNNETIKKYIDKFNFFNMKSNYQKSEENKQEENQLKLRNNLKQFLLANDHILGLSRIPINLYLLCSIWNNLSKKQDVGQLRATDLYCKMINHLMKRYIVKYKLNELISDNVDINNINAEYIEKKCDEEYQLLERIAFNAMKREEVIFGKEVFEQVKIENLANLRFIGLLKAVSDSKTIIDKKHYFIHLTFQEYFAARYIVRLLKRFPQEIELQKKEITVDHEEKYKIQEISEFIINNKYSRVHKGVIRFTSGLLAKDKKNERGLTLFWDIILNKRIDLILIMQWELITGCLEEAKLDDRIPDKNEILKYIYTFAEAIIVEDQITCEFIEVLNLNQTVKQMVLEKSNIIDKLRLKLKDHNANIRGLAHSKLCDLEIQDINIINELIAILDDPDRNVRGNAVNCLGHWKGKKIDILDKLVTMLDDPDESVKINVIFILSKSDIKDITIKDRISQIIQKRSPKTLEELKIDSNSINQIRVLLTSKSISTSKSVYDQNIYNVNLVNEFKPMLKDRDKWVRIGALSFLSKLNIGESNIVINELIPLLMDTENDIRWRSVNAIRNLKISKLLLIDSLVDSLKNISHLINNFDIENNLIKEIMNVFEHVNLSHIIKYSIKKLNNIFFVNKVLPNIFTKILSNRLIRNIAVTLEQDGIVIHRSRREKKILYPETWDEEHKITFSNQIFEIFYDINKQKGLPVNLPNSMMNCEKYFETDNSGYASITNDIILTKEQLEDSSISIIDNSVRISDCNTYAISIVRKAQSSDPYHTFLFIEGRNIFGNNSFYRFDLTYSRADDTAKIEINNSNLNVKSADRERVFQDNILKKRPTDNDFILGQNYHAITTIISKRAFEQLYAEIKDEQENIPKYNVRGIDAHIPSIFKHLPSNSFTNYYGKSESGHNCFTWAREKIKKYTNGEIYKSLGLADLALDRMTAHPGYYLGRQ